MTTATMPLPGALSLGIARGGVEIKSFFRQRDTMVFTFALPAIILAILATIFSGTEPHSGVTMSQFYAASMIAAGIASTSFLNLGIGIATDRQNGTLKRLHGTPMPAVSYFLGKVILVLVATLAEVALLLGTGVLFFDLELPAASSAWFTFGWVLLLGVAACSLLGILLSSLARSSQSATAIANLGMLILNFISGVYVLHLAFLPKTLVVIGSLFPVRWMAQGFRSVFLPDAVLYQEAAGAWEHERIALVLAAWCVGALVLCWVTFGKRGRSER